GVRSQESGGRSQESGVRREKYHYDLPISLSSHPKIFPSRLACNPLVSGQERLQRLLTKQ
ncbi:hypothetical protein V0288_15895, partial [Pannus brasiliensis CCIBt3594]